MILPFVREILADLERSPSFQRAATHLRGRAGRTVLSGLTQTAKGLHLPLLQRTVGRPVVLVVANNRAAEPLLQLTQAFAELTGAVDPKQVVKLPAYDVLPFENLSPHPELQEERAATLWKIANGEAAIVIAPLESACMRLRESDFYAALARTVRRNETL